MWFELDFVGAFVVDLLSGDTPLAEAIAAAVTAVVSGRG
jgi:hypothetical protein